MIICYCPLINGLERIALSKGQPVLSTAVWIDLIKPTDEERTSVEKLFGAKIPTREVIASIETSERFYLEPGGLVMTALMPSAIRSNDPTLSSVTFVLNAKRMVTVRYGEPDSLALLSRKVQSDASIQHLGPAILLALLDIVVDLIADEMEDASMQYDQLSAQVFGDGLNMRKTASYKTAIKQLGLIGLQVAKLHDVCASLARLLLYMSTHAKQADLSSDQMSNCKMLGRDIHSIKEHGDALDNKLAFLLDATVGLVSLEQNQIAKIFTVLGVIFLPPTLIASIYGMNFSNMPELEWQMGFLFSIGLMFTSVVVTFAIFRLMRLL